MKPIQMVDAATQYQLIKSEIDKAIHDVLDSGAYINGPAVKTFVENLSKYMEVPYVIPCANGTDALQIAMMALGLKRGDEVITPSFTYIATTEAVALLGLTPVFVEVDPDTFCMDPQSLLKAITPRTKAIVPVHLYGQSAPMKEIMDIAEKHNLFVIEDNAQAIGCRYFFADGTSKRTGTIGHIGCTSFYPTKNLGGFGDGGAIFTKDKALAEKIGMIVNHGQSKRYYHDRVGCNSRLDSIQAAVLNVKLANLDDYINERRKNAAYYDNAFAGFDRIKIPISAPYTVHTYNQYTLKIEGVSRDLLQAHLAEKHIPSMIYYPVPGHRQKMFDQVSALGNLSLPVTDRLCDTVISIPVYPELGSDQIAYIADEILKFVNRK